MPDAECADLKAASRLATYGYGWGMIPVGVQIGATSQITPLFPREGRSLAPVKAKVKLAEGDDMPVRLTLGGGRIGLSSE